MDWFLYDGNNEETIETFKKLQNLQYLVEHEK